MNKILIPQNSDLLIFAADEAQQIVNASSSAGLNDYEIVSKIREAKTTVAAATQSFLSLVSPLKDEIRAKVFMANLVQSRQLQGRRWRKRPGDFRNLRQTENMAR